MKALTALPLVAALWGCASPTPRVPIETVRSNYQNQLVKAGEPFATLSGYPYSHYSNTAWAAYVPSRVDGTATGIRQFGGASVGLYSPQVSLLKLKIPPGRHDVMVSGGKLTGEQTLLKNIEFKAGASYVITEKTSEKGERLVLISAYHADARFSIDEKEHYLVESPALAVAPLGNSK
ncbi:hypothetical protein [Variovorax boronicumulans]|uniref:hypothetical protein n=1 Tax=Variovorax boronicumulans TaxID=436515 RepID=UPI00339387B1